MKNKKLFCSFLICLLLMFGVRFAQAQGSATTFNNGITIANFTEISPKNLQISTFDTSSKEGNIIYRVFKDEKDKIYFGYDLEVKQTEKVGKFMVYISPLSYKSEKSNKLFEFTLDNFTMKNLPKYPPPFEINEGDTISLDIMENPETKEKIVDYTKVLFNYNSTDFFPERTPVRDFTISDVGIQITKFYLFADNQNILTVDGGASGSNIYVYLKGKGRFIFSLFPHEGYNFQKIGTIENNKIFFKYDGINYKIISSQPIVGSGGHWNLWVLHDENYKPSNHYNGSYQIGAMDTLNLKQ